MANWTYLDDGSIRPYKGCEESLHKLIHRLPSRWTLTPPQSGGTIWLVDREANPWLPEDDRVLRKLAKLAHGELQLSTCESAWTVRLVDRKVVEL